MEVQNTSQSLFFLFVIGAKHLISRMLDSNGKTRASITDVLTHPWLQLPVKKPPKQGRIRRAGVCNTPNEANDITSKIIAAKVAQCECSCHVSLPVGRDSAFIEHCDECRALSPIPTPNLFPTLCESRKGTLSTSSSGYSSTDSLSNFACPTPSKNRCDKENKCINKSHRKNSHPAQDFDNNALILI